MEEEGGEQEIFLDGELIAPVTSVNGKVGDVVLKASDLENDTNYQNGSQVAASIAAHNESDTAHADIRQTLAGKQDQLSADQLNAVNSGIDSTKVAQIATNTGNISDIDGKIPTQATPDNQLADKAFVNSSVQTATANFRGSWANWAAVPNDANDYPADYSGSKTPTVNDYLVLQDASDYTEETLTGTWRFKYSGTWATDGKSGWHPEYQVNETPLTAAQLAALNSNITAALTQKLQNIEAGAEVNKINGVKVNGVLLTPDSDKNVDVPVPTDFYTKAEINAGTDNLSVPSGFFSDSTKTTSATGNPVALTGTSEQVLSDVKLLGDSFQQTYAGKNKFGAQQASTTLHDVATTISDGLITLDGTTNHDGNIVTDLQPVNFTAKANTTYTITGRLVSGSLDIGDHAASIYLRKAGGTSITNAYVQIGPLVADGSQSHSFTVTEDTPLYLRVYANSAGIIFDDLVLSVQIEEGNAPTAFEPYVGGIPAPNPDYPQDVNVVTGTQTITLNDGGSNTRTATVRLGSLELVEIGNYQDYIWNDNGEWKKHKAIGAINIDPNSLSSFNNHSGSHITINYSDASIEKVSSTSVSTMSNRFSPANILQTWGGTVLNGVAQGNNGTYVQFSLDSSAGETLNDIKTYFSSRPTRVYYRTTDTDETITDATLIADLNALLNTKSFSPNTNAGSSAVSPNLPAFLTVEAFKNNLAGILAGNSTHIDRLEARVADLEANP